MYKDEVLDRIRQVRQEISEEHGHDPYRLVEYYHSLQERHRDRIRQVRSVTTVEVRET